MAQPQARSVEAGGLRHRLTIESLTRAVDGEGGPTKTWATAASRWGSVETLSGRQLDVAQARDARITHQIELWYYSGLAPATYRIKLGSRVFNIAFVSNVGQENRRMLVDAMEQV